MELKDSVSTDLWNNPNKLSEEMVRCMRDIFLCLSEPSDTASKASSSECFPYQPSPVNQPSPLMASSDSSFITSSSQNVSTDTRLSNEIVEVDRFDPYGVNGKIKWRKIGCYSMAMEVSWMSVGKAQLEYAAEALKGYRYGALLYIIVKGYPKLLVDKHVCTTYFTSRFSCTLYESYPNKSDLYFSACRILSIETTDKMASEFPKP